MLIDDGICENCLAKNHCDVLPYSNNCNEVRAMAKHDKQVYNKAIDDFKEELVKESHYLEGHYGTIYGEDVYKIAKQLKAGGTE